MANRDLTQISKSSCVDEDWVEVRSRRGLGRFPANVTKAIAPGTVFVPMHWGALWADNAEGNALTLTGG